jgi:4-diphosphocytidyl-2-C-methyl-D-erythritol kinase
MIEELSPAKVNLFFRVLNERPDGYHEVASFYSAVNLFDKLYLKFSSKDIFESNVDFLKLDSSNLIIRALSLFRDKTKIFDPVHIKLEKNIPAGAGLGGGSSNAATILYMLNNMFSNPLTNEDLIHFGSKIGMDVPFFFSSGMSYCRGRGEEIEDIEFEYKKNFFISKPRNFQLLTKDVYGGFLSKDASTLEPLNILQSFKNGREILVNDLELAAFRLEPNLKDFKKKLLQLGFDKVVMTGSGSAFLCFGDVKNPTLLNTDFYHVSTIKKNYENWYGDINL